MINNPFIISNVIPDEFFCDREIETKTLINNLINGVNVTLIAPRRMGKSALINHCFSQPDLKNYFSVYIDILQTSSLQEFVFLLGKAVYEKIVPKTTKWVRNFFRYLKSLSGKISFDAVSGMPSFNFMMGEINNPAQTLDEIFEFLRNYNGNCIIAIDEFQQITKYPEKNVEAVLRSYILQQNNTHFIFSGSERHLMQEMFLSYSRPFYDSTSIMTLDAIPENIYVDFAKHLFEAGGKKIENETIRRLYNLFNGVTFYPQIILNSAYYRCDGLTICNDKMINEIIIQYLETSSTIYRETLANISERQKQLLYVIGIKGVVENITSAKFIKDNALMSASSVQTSAKKLLESDLIVKQENKYYMNDKFFGLWIRMVYGPSPFHI